MGETSPLNRDRQGGQVDVTPELDLGPEQDQDPEGVKSLERKARRATVWSGPEPQT